MIFFRPVKGSCRLDLCPYLAFPFLLVLLFERPCNLFLFFRMDEDDVLILGPCFVGGRVVLPVDFLQFPVRYFFWIVFQPNGFGMVPELIIGGLVFVATCITDTGSLYTFEMPVQGIGGPESAQREGGCFQG